MYCMHAVRLVIMLVAGILAGAVLLDYNGFVVMRSIFFKDYAADE